MPWVVWTVTNWYLCSWHTFWRISWPVFMQPSVIPDLQVVYFICDMKCHLITWRFITTSSVATFGVTLKKGRAIMEFHFVCFICYSVCGLLMLMNWWSDSCFCIFWTCTTACCRLCENYCPVFVRHFSLTGLSVFLLSQILWSLTKHLYQPRVDDLLGEFLLVFMQTVQLSCQIISHEKLTYKMSLLNQMPFCFTDECSCIIGQNAL